MSKVVLALASASLLCLAGCADTYGNKSSSAPSAVPVEAAKPSLSAEAQAALDKAKADVKDAKSKNALWTTAENALKAAETAATQADSATVLKQAKLASDHVQKGLAQLNYPMLKLGD